MKVSFELFKMGDDHLFIRFSKEIDLTLNQFIRCVYDLILKEQPEGLIEVYFAYSSMLVHFDRERTSFAKLSKRVGKIINQTVLKEDYPFNRIVIPVRYDHENGRDLAFAAEYLKISEEQIIQIHTSRVYHVYMLGFLPGFCYLGGLDERIFLPRLTTPRTKIEKGSVGIGNNQTGIYPLDSPGGWRIIGKTDVELFSPECEKPFIILPGDEILFERVR
ncbi:MAG: 5-oxoprolinase subunit PxpB [Clostridia bacterium]|nr:5-oxoprolinase subunit PxpB [Clostridia bacterium]